MNCLYLANQAFDLVFWFMLVTFAVSVTMSSNLLEYDPDRYSDNFAQAGPISSYKTLEARI